MLTVLSSFISLGYCASNFVAITPAFMWAFFSSKQSNVKYLFYLSYWRYIQISHLGTTYHAYNRKKKNEAANISSRNHGVRISF